MKNQHRGIIPMYNTGIAIFFTIAVVFVIIFVNIGFSINDSQKDVVEDAYDEVREQLEVSGKISAAADVSSNKIMVAVCDPTDKSSTLITISSFDCQVPSSCCSAVRPW